MVGGWGTPTASYRKKELCLASWYDRRGNPWIARWYLVVFTTSPKFGSFDAPCINCLLLWLLRQLELCWIGLGEADGQQSICEPLWNLSAYIKSPFTPVYQLLPSSSKSVVSSGFRLPFGDDCYPNFVVSPCLVVSFIDDKQHIVCRQLFNGGLRLTVPLLGLYGRSISLMLHQHTTVGTQRFSTYPAYPFFNPLACTRQSIPPKLRYSIGYDDD